MHSRLTSLVRHHAVFAAGQAPWLHCGTSHFTAVAVLHRHRHGYCNSFGCARRLFLGGFRRDCVAVNPLRSAHVHCATHPCSRYGRHNERAISATILALSPALEFQSDPRNCRLSAPLRAFICFCFCIDDHDWHQQRVDSACDGQLPRQ